MPKEQEKKILIFKTRVVLTSYQFLGLSRLRNSKPSHLRGRKTEFEVLWVPDLAMISFCYRTWNDRIAVTKGFNRKERKNGSWCSQTKWVSENLRHTTLWINFHDQPTSNLHFLVLEFILMTLRIRTLNLQWSSTSTCHQHWYLAALVPAVADVAANFFAWVGRLARGLRRPGALAGGVVVVGQRHRKTTSWIHRRLNRSWNWLARGRSDGWDENEVLVDFFQEENDSRKRNGIVIRWGTHISSIL